jgi:endonuclease/exonuclease/phosphatase (EEP) superfamily protein YafD
MNAPLAPEFRVVFWNVWMDGQLHAAGLRALRDRLGQLIDRYDPDAFGLNEVIMDRTTGLSPVLQYLESRGYHTHFTVHSPDSHNTFMGVALASRRRPHQIVEPVLGPDTSAAKRGLPGHEVRAIIADLPVGGVGATVKVVVNYWAHLVPYNWRTHQLHARSFHQAVTNLGDATPVIIGGDFNELKHMPAIRQLTQTFNRATGTLLQPTWRWNGQRRWLAQANYDHLLWSRQAGVELKDFQVLPIAPSDHAPLLGRFLIL